MSISFVITSYNRSYCICNTLDSILIHNKFNIKFEIIVVDDASSDNTVDLIQKKYNNEINHGVIKLIPLNKNVGVTGAKNKGFFVANYDWVVFLDSDDLLIKNIVTKMFNILQKNSYKAIVFFRCIDQNKKFVGKKFENEKIIEIEEFVENVTYGESLAVVNKKIVNFNPYITELRGYERLGCARIINKFKYGLLSNLVVRIYLTDGKDRLSIGKGFYKRMPLLAKGHYLMLKEFSQFMTFKNVFFYFLKMIIYFIIGKVYNRIKK